jgi:hypothetical protein
VPQRLLVRITDRAQGRIVEDIDEAILGPDQCAGNARLR